jgi:hypothetical protein
MKSMFAATVAALFLTAPHAHAQSNAVSEEAIEDPSATALAYFRIGQFGKVDWLINQLATTQARTVDGRFQLFMTTWGLSDWFEAQDEDSDPAMRALFKQWGEQFPKSEFMPILRAIQMNASGWRARGRGFNSTVTEEGRYLFNERSGRAWNQLMDCKDGSDKLPIWYQHAITIGLDAGVPDEVLRPLVTQGMRKFPGYHPIQFAYARQLSPRWGGNYADADAFITEQVAAPTNPEGEILYARLYWLIDQYSGTPENFFSESLVIWPRMRAGFELLMKSYPASAWNQANFASYACRANDAKTYASLRRKVDPTEFARAASRDLPLDACDARFRKKK